MAPVGFNALHVPLVDHGHDILAGTFFENLVKQVWVFGIYESFLLIRTKTFKVRYEPVSAATVDGFCENFATVHGQGIIDIFLFFAPETVVGCISIIEHQGNRVNRGLNLEGIKTVLVEFHTTENNFGVDFLGCLEGELHLETRSEGMEVFSEVFHVIQNKKPAVKASGKKEFSGVLVHTEGRALHDFPIIFIHFGLILNLNFFA